MPSVIDVSSMAIICILLVCVPLAQALGTAELNAVEDLAKAFGISGWDSNTTSDPCKWDGITCNKDGGNVTEISLANKGYSGSIPSSIGNLSALTKLELYQNNLNGNIPASVGKLSLLQELSLGTNAFSGSIPPEIGNLRSLKNLQLDNNKLNGTIPSSIGDLTHLQELIMPTNSLTGSIPDEIGKLTNLTKLWLHSNQMSGPLPQSFANLSSMSDLTLSYNSFSGNISFIQSMPMLQLLKLNRNKFSGPIPNVSLANLTVCDLGFNNFDGNIPVKLAVSNLNILLVGHNQLEGSIPQAFGNLSKLSRLDVSHNILTGSTTHLASIKERDFSFNYFADQNSSLDLNCNAASAEQEVCFPSTTGSEGAFRVNAGGAEITVDGETYVADSTEVSTGLHHIGNTSWTMEISGLEGANYSTETSRGGNTSSKNQAGVYATAKWSSNYLAYHGTNLTNGNYNVTLYFIETYVYSKNARVFDVFVQGQLVLQNLDLWAEAGNDLYTHSINASVTNGTISIKLIGSRYNYYYTIGSGPIISAISVTPMNSNKKSSKRILIGGITGGLAAFFMLVFAVCFVVIHRRRSSRRSADNEPLTQLINTNTIENISKIGPTIYTYQQLWEATNGFDDKFLLGKGGFGAVHKGILPDGTVVAIKQLMKKSTKDAQIFKKEIAILSMLQHKNLVGINGYCIGSENSLLVCDYMENGSLEKALFTGPGLDWKTRMKIAIGAACGLQYLHEESKYHVIHCDVKPANILLDKDMNACVADFGLARFFKEKTSKTVENKAGTFGYMAPEYIYYNELSDKVDVYSFGVVLLGLLSGERPVRVTTKSWDDDATLSKTIVEQAHELALAEPSNVLELIDERLNDKFDKQEVLDMSIVALLCTQEDPNARPRMRDVWLMLNKTITILPLPNQMPTAVVSEDKSLETFSHGL